MGVDGGWGGVEGTIEFGVQIILVSRLYSGTQSSRHIPCAVHPESSQKLDCERHGGACLNLWSAVSQTVKKPAARVWIIPNGVVCVD